MKTVKDIAKEILEEYIRNHRSWFEHLMEIAIESIIRTNIDEEDTLKEALTDKLDYFDMIDDISEAADELVEEEF